MHAVRIFSSPTLRIKCNSQITGNPTTKRPHCIFRVDKSIYRRIMEKECKRINGVVLLVDSSPHYIIKFHNYAFSRRKATTCV